MKTIAIESPYSGNIARNVRYLAWCVRYVYDCGHAASAGHGLGPCAQSEEPLHRAHGLAADARFREICDETWYFADLGWSAGMMHPRPKEWYIKLLPRKLFLAFERGEWPPGATLQWVPR